MHFIVRLTQSVLPVVAIVSLLGGAGDFARAATPGGKHKRGAAKTNAASATAKQFAEAIAAGDTRTVGRLDFHCLYRLRAAQAKPVAAYPPENDAYYAQCRDGLEVLHARAIDQKDRAMDTVWPGRGNLIFYQEELNGYPPSAFVMPELGQSPPGSGLHVDILDHQAIPAASFRLQEGGPILVAGATLVRTRVTYRDPILSPVSYAPGAYKFANTVKRPIAAIKSLTLRWVVLAGLKKLGFPADMAVVNSQTPDAAGVPIPFVTEPPGYEANSGQWWKSEDAPGLLIAGVGRAVLLPEVRDRVALLNRVLTVDPAQPDALTALSRDLFQTVLEGAKAARPVTISDVTLSNRLGEFYWDTYAHTARTALSIGMEMGGYRNPTEADYLLRMIPAMEQLAKVRPEDLENRLRLGIAYRWNLDQDAAIDTHERLLKDLPPERAQVRARALVELAWSRILKVAWNRMLDDPNIEQAYKDAEQALSVAERPIDKFAAAYTMAYSRIFMPNRDNKAMLENLTEARKWFEQVAGTSPQVWQYLLSNETVKAVMDADPSFQSLFAASPTPAS
jgi:tetratricopeptide (TPR) repeat protein